MSSLTCLTHSDESNEQINSPTLEGFCMMTQGQMWELRIAGVEAPA